MVKNLKGEERECSQKDDRCVKGFKTRVNSPGIHAIWEKGKAELPYKTRKQAWAPAGMVRERQAEKHKAL